MNLQDWMAQEPETRTPEWLAAELGCHVSTVYRYRNGTRIPGRNALRQLARLTDGQVTANDFVGCEAAA